MNLRPDHILQTGLAFWSSKALLTAVELGLFSQLAGRSLSLEALQTQLGLHPRGTRDFLDALLALGFLHRDENGYRNTPETELFLDRAKPSYIGGMLEMANQRLYPTWGNLTEALRTGQPQNGLNENKDIFAELYANPETLQNFLSAMSGVSHAANGAIARQFPWSKYTTCADIGAAQGNLITQILLANPHLHGIGFDLPQVGPIFEKFTTAQGISGRVQFQAGNFFEENLPTAEVLLFGHILHDWDLETKKMLLTKAYAALPAGGAVVVYEAIIDDDRSTNAFGLLMSLNMLVETESGFDYTGADCINWLEEAGFENCQIEPLVGPDSMVIGYKQ